MEVDSVRINILHFFSDCRHGNKAFTSRFCGVWDWLRRTWKIRRGSWSCYESWQRHRRLFPTFLHDFWFASSLFWCQFGSCHWGCFVEHVFQPMTWPICRLVNMFVSEVVFFFFFFVLWMIKTAEKEEYKNKMRFLMGESMGGAVALLLHRKEPQFWDGAILVAPMCKVWSLFLFLSLFCKSTHVIPFIITLLNLFSWFLSGNLFLIFRLRILQASKPFE